jgi:predicted kinase
MKLIVFTGLPGSGKTSVAEAVARHLRISLFAKDWLEATLLNSALVADDPRKPLGYAAYELLTTLAHRQLMLGQSVILDSVASVEPIRTQWRTLALEYNAAWHVIECVCSDEKLYRVRLATRQRGIPGWPELDWSEVERVRSYYAPWDEDRLILDAVEPLSDNIEKALAYIANADGRQSA